jgi:hypothetical protein
MEKKRVWVSGSSCAARAEGSGAAAGADPRAGGASAGGGHAARARVPLQDPGAPPPRPAHAARRAGAVRRGSPRKSFSPLGRTNDGSRGTWCAAAVASLWIPGMVGVVRQQGHALHT